MTDNPRICDYEGSTYRTDFWEGKGRTYEDRVERGVLRQLLPSQGKRLVEIGAAFGRLVAEYEGFEQVVLLDYSFSQLQEARKRLGDERFVYVAANAYQLPFKAGVFDAVTMIRVLHHFENVPAVLAQIYPTLAPKGTFVLEFANKLNLKALLRYALGKQAWNPRDLAQVEFVEMNFNFHPQTIQEALHHAGFTTHRRVPVSWLRVNLLKRLMPLEALLAVDALLQKSGWLVAPSVFTQNTVPQEGVNQLAAEQHDIFACPLTKTALKREGDTLTNAQGTRWQIRDGIYYFKEPMD